MIWCRLGYVQKHGGTNITISKRKRITLNALSFRYGITHNRKPDDSWNARCQRWCRVFLCAEKCRARALRILASHSVTSGQSAELQRFSDLHTRTSTYIKKNHMSSAALHIHIKQTNNFLICMYNKGSWRFAIKKKRRAWALHFLCASMHLESKQIKTGCAPGLLP